MDKYLKERLVGAAVLVAAAVIIIPEMLSGPTDNTQVVAGEEGQGATTDANGVKTYTIDLTKTQTPTNETTVAPQKSLTEKSGDGSGTEPRFADAPSMPADNSANSIAAPTQNQGAPASSTVDHASDRTQVVPATTASADKPTEKLADRPAPAATKSSEPAKSAQTTASTVQPVESHGQVTGDAWAVQVASLAARNSSEQLAADLRAKGFKAFVMKFENKGQTLYRVRVGPVPDRESADNLLAKVKALHPKAAVVPN